MNITCQTLLRLIFDHEQDHSNPLQISSLGCEQIPDAQALRDAVNALISRGYVISAKPVLRSFCLTLTEKGETYVRNGFVSIPEQSQTSFNFSGATINNATIGNNNSVGAMNYSSVAALAEIQEAIARQPSADQAALHEMLDVLRDIQTSQQPIEKSRLARFYEVVKKSSDLVLPISKFLFEVFFKG